MYQTTLGLRGTSWGMGVEYSRHNLNADHRSCRGCARGPSHRLRRSCSTRLLLIAAATLHLRQFFFAQARPLDEVPAAPKAVLVQLGANWGTYNGTRLSGYRKDSREQELMLGSKARAQILRHSMLVLLTHALPPF